MPSVVMRPVLGFRLLRGYLQSGLVCFFSVPLDFFRAFSGNVLLWNLVRPFDVLTLQRTAW